MKQILITLIILPLSITHAAILYSMDFSIDGQGATHDNTGSDPLEVSPISGTNWTLTYASLDTDSTTNSFLTTGGQMIVDDWGGLGTVTSKEITIPSDGSFTLNGSASVTDFNAATEGFSWFYSHNGMEVEFGQLGRGFGESDVTGTQDNSITAFTPVDVNAGDLLTIGFKVNVNGLGDGATISSLSLDFTPVPEPSSLFFLGLTDAGLLSMRLRKRKNA